MTYYFTFFSFYVFLFLACTRNLFLLSKVYFDYLYFWLFVYSGYFFSSQRLNILYITSSCVFLVSLIFSMFDDSFSQTRKFHRTDVITNMLIERFPTSDEFVLFFFSNSSFLFNELITAARIHTKYLFTEISVVTIAKILFCIVKFSFCLINICRNPLLSDFKEEALF